MSLRLAAVLFGSAVSLGQTETSQSLRTDDKGRIAFSNAAIAP